MPVTISVNVIEMPLVKAIEKHEEVIEAQHEDGKNDVFIFLHRKNARKSVFFRKKIKIIFFYFRYSI